MTLARAVLSAYLFLEKKYVPVTGVKRTSQDKVGTERVELMGFAYHAT